MQDETKIVVDILSTENVRVKLIDSLGTFYDSTMKNHGVTFTRLSTSYDASVANSTIFATGPSAVMTGSIKARHVHVVQIWLPWWMP